MNLFYAQINRGHLRNSRGYSGETSWKNNEDEDNSPKTLIFVLCKASICYNIFCIISKINRLIYAWIFLLILTFYFLFSNAQIKMKRKWVKESLRIRQRKLVEFSDLSLTLIKTVTVNQCWWELISLYIKYILSAVSNTNCWQESAVKKHNFRLILFLRYQNQIKREERNLYNNPVKKNLHSCS